jgi:hypothetical protein
MPRSVVGTFKCNRPRCNKTVTTTSDGWEMPFCRTCCNALSEPQRARFEQLARKSVFNRDDREAAVEEIRTACASMRGAA